MTRAFDAEDGVIVLDTTNNSAHRLESLAAKIWNLSDGSHSVDAIAKTVGASNEVVTATLNQLADLDLLTEESTGRTRRSMLASTAKIGAAVAVSVPLIESLALPAAAMAFSANHTVVFTNPTTGNAYYNLNGAGATAFTTGSTYYVTQTSKSPSTYGVSTTAPGGGVAYISFSIAVASGTSYTLTVKNESGASITLGGTTVANTATGTGTLTVGSTTVTLDF